MKNIFGNYQLFAIDINDGELPIKTAPIFEIDKFTREFSSKQEIIDMLNERGYHIKDIKLKKITKNKDIYTDILFDEDWPIPVNTEGLSDFLKRDKPSLLSKLLIPIYLLDYRRYISYRNLYILINNDEYIKDEEKTKQKVK